MNWGLWHEEAVTQKAYICLTFLKITRKNSKIISVLKENETKNK